MKKLFLILLAAFLTFGFIACTEETTTTQTTADVTTQTTQTDTVTTTETTVQTTTTEALTTTEETTVVTTIETTTAEQFPVFEGVVNRTSQLPDTVDLLEGITATDPQDGDITADIVVDQGNFDHTVKGTYTINLYVIDSDGNRTDASYTIQVLDNRYWAEYDANQVTLGTPLTLPLYGSNGTFFYWSSNNTQVITTQGYVINPPVSVGPVDVTLTLRAVNGSATYEKDFVVTIQPNPEVTVTSSVQVPFDGTSTEYVVEDKAAIDLFFVDNGTVPYIDVQTFINMVDGAIESSIINVTPDGTNGLIISYTVEYLDFDEVTTITENYEAYIDFDLNTFTVNNFDFFGGYISSTESDYGSGLIYTGADYVDGNEVTIPLGNYNFDLTIYEEGGETFYLMPLAVTNLLFLGDVYYDAYYNGDKIYGIDTFAISGDDTELINQIRSSSKNGEDMAFDMKLATYNYMALVIDYFYGLKEDKNITSGYDIMSAYAKSLLTQGDQNLYNKLFDIAYGLDDLHTSHAFPGYYETPYSMGLSLSDLGPGTVAFYEGLWAVQDKLVEKYGGDPETASASTFLDENRPEYTLLNNDTLAVIHLDGFTIDTPDEFKAILDGLPTTVVDVVIDLSYNTGGNLGAVLRIWGYMTEESFNYHSQNPADGAAVTYYIESDYVAYDYNWYVLTSGVTFSAANLFANIAKEMGVPVIGQDSSGGASSIGVVITPDGSALIISTNNVLSTRVGNEVDGYEYLSIEYGIEVDYTMTDVTSDTQLINVVEQIKSATTE